jgi:6-phosphofructokinase 1
MRVAISTGGGDAPGLNAVIRAVVLGATNRGWEVFGIRRGFGGLLGDARVVEMSRDSVRGITHLGGTILGTTNRGNPFSWPILGTDGTWVEEDRSQELLDAFRAHGFDALIAVGGDGTLRIAYRLSQLGLPIVGVPKTIDNDVAGTDYTFGFDTAVQTATEALDKLHSTAESHERVMVVEVMGRTAGWIALTAGLAGGADVILIPEVPFDIERVCDKVREREASGQHVSIVVVAEGASSRDGKAVFRDSGAPGAMARLGGIGDDVAQAIAERTGKETRSLTLGHLQRGGSPTTRDRILGLRFGAAAVRAVAARRFGIMVALDGIDMTERPLEGLEGAPRVVQPDSELLHAARDLGTALGD